MRAHRAEQIIPSWRKSDTRRKRPARAWSGVKKQRADEKRRSLGGLLMSFSKEWSKTRGGSGEQTIAHFFFSLPHFLFFCSFLKFLPLFLNQVTISHQPVPHKECSQPHLPFYPFFQEKEGILFSYLLSMKQCFSARMKCNFSFWGWWYQEQYIKLTWRKFPYGAFICALQSSHCTMFQGCEQRPCC